MNWPPNRAENEENANETLEIKLPIKDIETRFTSNHNKKIVRRRQLDKFSWNQSIV
ncbi:hypothetical protein O9992_24335 [Vibrio lentus]|nr:hypothetical protein [Vibrio lentus]